MVVPQSITDSLIARLNARASEGPLSEFEFAMYAKEAEALRKAVPAEGYCVLGIISCLANDVESMRKHHETAIRLDQESSLPHFNYGMSLEVKGFDEEAMHQYLAAIEKEPRNIRNLNRAINLAYAMNHEELDSLLKLWSEINGGEEHSVREDEEITSACTNISMATMDDVWGGAEEDEAWAFLQ